MSTPSNLLFCVASEPGIICWCFTPCPTLLRPLPSNFRYIKEVNCIVYVALETNEGALVCQRHNTDHQLDAFVKATSNTMPYIFAVARYTCEYLSSETVLRNVGSFRNRNSFPRIVPVAKSTRASVVPVIFIALELLDPTQVLKSLTIT